MTPISPTPTPSNATTAFAQSVADTKTTLNSDFETFLQMLTAQMENQDPLNPIDSSEYAAQLAAFSSVEQQVLTNDLLSGLSAQLNTSSLAQLSNWVGMEARSSAGVAFDGAPQTLHPTPSPLADEAYLVVYDQAGNQVQRLEITTSGEAVEWAGVTSGGAPVDNGTYHFVVENYANGEALGPTAVESYQTIKEAQMVDGQIVLVLHSGQSLLPGSVLALRDPN